MASSSSLLAVETLLRAGRAPSDPEFRNSLARLGTELIARFNRDTNSPDAADYFSSALRTLTRLRGSSNGKIRAEALFECYRFFHLNGNRTLAWAAATQMREAARHVKNTYLACKAEMLLGIVHAENHCIGDALIHYSRSIEIADRDKHMPSLAATWLNLGNALNYGSLYGDAIPCFKRAHSLALLHDMARLVEAPALCNLAQSFYYLEEYEKSLEAITRSLAASSAPSNPHEVMQRIIREMTYVMVSSAMHLREESRYHTGICNEFARRLGTSRAEFFAKLATGICEVRFGDHSHGLDLLQACVSSPITELTALRMDALEMLVRAYDEAERPQEALSFLNEWIEQIRRSRKEGIFQLSSLGFQPNGLSWGASRDLRALESLGTKIELRIAKNEAANTRVEMLERLAIAADLKEDITGQHGFRVGALCRNIAVELGWNPDEIYVLEVGARLHDLGKTAIPDRILLSSALLEEAHRQFICTHTKVGAELLSGSSIPQLRLAEAIARFHHEWWNGEGYPSKLSGNRIPIHARIVALADVFDALTHGRPYAPAWPVERALAEIRSRRGTQFDPELTDVFLNLMERLISEHEDLDAYLGQASRHSPFLQARNKIRQMLDAERENERRATVEGNQTRH